MADETLPPDLNEIADVCREAGYVVAEIDRGLEVSGSDDGGAFYLFREGEWLQARCQVFDEADLERARDLTALFETVARAQFRMIGCRFGFDELTGLWLVADLYPGFEPERLPAVLEQLAFVWGSLGEVLDAALKGTVVDEITLDAAFELEPDGRPN
ncbi:hypothetical protein [Caulobacter sp. UNC279MFTsu5.1]|uniref:hypothetical protein n=1 Tax=Caulobacter sp. UNC279MFTsu5.1 TaxID=1502775 RepID=UPI0008EC0C53|nr:hypothetical protein [Caulobacter sp. UNC279MFTsu5.1]SFI84025.1 hypothetical protein SAMN02799626_00656 [Caulobacter sp. UNC279MFTsu5.1]